MAQKKIIKNMLLQKNIKADKINSSTGKKIKYFFENNYYFVEEFAQKIYEKEGFSSIWTENNYWWKIYALLFWDIIFSKIDGVWSPEFGQEFPNEYQDMPRDLFSDNFYSTRENLFKNRIKELGHVNIKEKLVDSYNSNFKKRCRLIENWDKFSIDQLCVAVDLIEKDEFLKIIERLFKDFNYNRAGLPDLFVYSNDKYFFVEVKSEKDKISPKQTEWHSFLSDELGIDVEIFLVNKNNKEKKEKNKNKNNGIIKISFGKSTSKKRNEAISFIEKQEKFEKMEENGDIVYSAYFGIRDIENLYTMLDYTSGWKTQKIELDEKSIHSTKLRNSLWCYREKVKTGKSLDYCRKNEWDGSVNRFGCKSFYFNELEQNSWREYGYIDTKNGEWIFDKEKIKQEINNQLEQLNFCPIFNSDKILKLFKSIPDKVNPQIDISWSFVDNNFDLWSWKNDHWKNEWGEKKFPGYSLVVGVEKNSKRNKKETANINIDIQNSGQERKRGFFEKLFGN
jgi:hypothetical protein